MRDYTIQLYGDYNKRIRRIPTKQKKTYPFLVPPSFVSCEDVCHILSFCDMGS